MFRQSIAHFRHRVRVHAAPARRSHSRLHVIALLLAWAACDSVSAAPVSLTVVAKTGAPFNGVTLDAFQFGARPAIDLNNSGDVAFGGFFDAGDGPFSGAGVFTSTGFFAGKGSVVAGKTLTDAFNPSINDAADIVFAASFDSFPTTAIFTPTSILAQSGDVIAGRTLTSPQEPSINNNGDVVFRSRTGQNAFSIFSPSTGVVVLPVAIGGISLGQISGAAALSDTGGIAFRGQSFAFGFGIFTEDRHVMGNNVSVDGETVSSFLNPGISPTGDIVFMVTGSGIGKGIAVDSAQVLSIVVRTGDVVDGRTLTDIANTDPPSINSAGEIAFIGVTASGRGIFTQDRVIAEVGDSLLGSTISSVSAPVINDQGQIAFYAGLANGVDALVVTSLVPEPTAIVLLGVGLASTLGRRRRGRPQDR